MHRILRNLLNAVLALCSVWAPVARAQDRLPGAVIFEDVRIFNGISNQLSAPSIVLTVEGVIKTISSAPMADPPNVAVQRIRGGGRTLMTGLIDGHWHAMLAAPSMSELMEADLGYLPLLASVEAEATLMRGFTTVRDLGGPSFALKRSIDEGVVVGPRIYPSAR